MPKKFVHEWLGLTTFELHLAAARTFTLGKLGTLEGVHLEYNQSVTFVHLCLFPAKKGEKGAWPFVHML